MNEYKYLEAPVNINASWRALSHRNCVSGFQPVHSARTLHKVLIYVWNL